LIKRGAANGEEFARSACSFVKQNSTLPQLRSLYVAAYLCIFLQGSALSCSIL
jgi:hypothetical protein